MAFIRTIAVSTTAFERTKEILCGFGRLFSIFKKIPADSKGHEQDHIDWFHNGLYTLVNNPWFFKQNFKNSYRI